MGAFYFYFQLAEDSFFVGEEQYTLNPDRGTAGVDFRFLGVQCSCRRCGGGVPPLLSGPLPASEPHCSSAGVAGTHAVPKFDATLPFCQSSAHLPARRFGIVENAPRTPSVFDGGPRPRSLDTPLPGHGKLGSPQPHGGPKLPGAAMRALARRDIRNEVLALDPLAFVLLSPFYMSSALSFLSYLSALIFIFLPCVVVWFPFIRSFLDAGCPALLRRHPAVWHHSFFRLSILTVWYHLIRFSPHRSRGAPSSAVRPFSLAVIFEIAHHVG